MTHFIAICDDEKGICAELEIIIIDILNKMNIMYEIDVYYSGEDLYKKMESGAQYNLIFLDIEFAQSSINGVEIGKLIREAHNNNMVSIIFISWEMKYAMQLFDIRPINFLLKPLEYVKIEKDLNTYLKLIGFWTGDFTYKIGHDTYKVHLRDIVYLESDKRKITLHLSNGKTEEFYGSLKEVYQTQLQKFDFLFIHASFIVNYDYISAIKYNELILTNRKTPLPISQQKRKEIRETYYGIIERRRI